MANLLNRFKQTQIRNKNNIANSSYSYDITDFISTIEPKGDFKQITDLNVIFNSWTNILMTPTRTDLCDPDYGSDLYKYVFDQADKMTSDNIKREVEYKINKYDNRAKIIKINVKYFSNKKGFAVEIFVNYKGNKDSLNLIIDENLYFNILRSV